MTNTLEPCNYKEHLKSELKELFHGDYDVLREYYNPQRQQRHHLSHEQLEQHYTICTQEHYTEQTISDNDYIDIDRR